MDSIKHRLICPKCGKDYNDDYTAYFACWTSHLEAKFSIITTNHTTPLNPIDYYRTHPNEIRQGLKILTTRVKIFQGQIDLIGVDVDNSLVLIDITSNVDWQRRTEQLSRYKGKINWIASNILGLPRLNIKSITIRPPTHEKPIVIQSSSGVGT